MNGGTDESGDDEFIAPENISAGIIPLLERNTTAQTLLRGRAYFLQRLIKALLVAEGFEGFEASVSVAHLENRLAAALLLGARDEVRIALGLYPKRRGGGGAAEDVVGRDQRRGSGGGRCGKEGDINEGEEVVWRGRADLWLEEA